MIGGVEFIDHKQGVLEEVRLPQHTVGLEGTREVVDDDFRCLLPPCVEYGENIVPTL